MRLDLNDYPQSAHATQFHRVNAPRCYFNKSSSSSSPTANNAQGSAENGSAGIGGNNSNSNINVNVTTTSLDPQVALTALTALEQGNANAITAVNSATTSALTASVEANLGTVSVANNSLALANNAISQVVAGSNQAQQFVNENTALAFNTISQLVTGQTDALAYQTSTAGGSTSNSSGNGSAPASVVYVGPANAAPDTNAALASSSGGAINNYAGIITIVTGVIFLYIYLKHGRATV